MSTPLNASATTAGTLISSSIFEVPKFQREYAWGEEEVNEFWSDLKRNLRTEPYFLGLVILTDENNRKHVVDGQQRLITLTLMASAIYYKAKELGRKALAERIQADFLQSINYETDETEPRLVLADEHDFLALNTILDTGNSNTLKIEYEKKGLSIEILDSYSQLQTKLNQDIASDPFKQLGSWADFITNKLYFAVFVHPDPGSAYRVFEVINTRGVELTTADLLKNYILSQITASEKDAYYEDWRSLAIRIESIGEQSFVQYIRHIVTSYRGHILPKDLFDFLAQRHSFGKKKPPSPKELVKILKENLDIYIQMMSPKQEGPADPEALRIFTALNDLSVISVRPVLLSIIDTPNAIEGMQHVLRLVVRRIVVGNLGTGNVERRFGEISMQIREQKSWESVIEELEDLNPSKEEFVNRLERRSLNQRVLTFIRHSLIQQSITPSLIGVLHLIRPRNITIEEWPGFEEAEVSYLTGTLGNTFLTKEIRRDTNTHSWEGFKEIMIDQGIDGEMEEELRCLDTWSANELRDIAKQLAEVAGNVWY